MQQSHLSREIIQLAAQHQLGDWHTTYIPFDLRYSRAITTYLLLLITTILFVLSFLMHWEGLLFPLLGVIILISALALQIVLAPGSTIYVFANGIVTVQNDQSEVIRWEQIKNVWWQIDWRWMLLASGIVGLSIPFAVIYGSFNLLWGMILYLIIYKLVGEVSLFCLENGRLFRFKKLYYRGNMLYETLRQETSPFLVSQSLALYHSSQRIDFGSLHIDHEGINCKGRRVLWQHITAIKSFEHRLVITKKDGKRVSWSDLGIPNSAVAVTLANQLLADYTHQKQLLLHILNHRCNSLLRQNQEEGSL